eukprot:NODE_45_length_32908_cov_0.790271.p23 type:complete len:141 gc:universal NODE_45_length_32908_cov_0.790271:26392-26814(+)
MLKWARAVDGKTRIQCVMDYAVWKGFVCQIKRYTDQNASHMLVKHCVLEMELVGILTMVSRNFVQETMCAKKVNVLQQRTIWVIVTVPFQGPMRVAIFSAEEDNIVRFTSHIVCQTVPLQLDIHVKWTRHFNRIVKHLVL